MQTLLLDEDGEDSDYDRDDEPIASHRMTQEGMEMPSND
jgi:hypothetical protein